MIFRRPELEKDNPIAPQPYVGPRRRLAMARATALENSSEVGDMEETLQTLVNAASQLLRDLPKVRRSGKSVKVVQDAIAHAEQVLAAENHSRL
ncbi:MAG: hypothetical protein HC938_05835 [Nitrospira sp.]|nr:hypothetical protein [Nitrospira sp.]